MFLEGQKQAGYATTTVHSAGVFTPEVAWRRFWISKTGPAAICSQPASPASPATQLSLVSAGVARTPACAAPVLPPAGCPARGCCALITRWLFLSGSCDCFYQTHLTRILYVRYPAKNLTTVATCLKADFMNSGASARRDRNFEASNYLFSSGASDRKMSLGFYCLPDVMSWLYPISIVDILKINKNLWLLFFDYPRKSKLTCF